MHRAFVDRYRRSIITIRGSLPPFSLRIRKILTFERIDDDRWRTGDGCLWNSRVPFNEATRLVLMVSLPRMRVVCGLVSVALNSALHESPSTYSAYLHACTDKISRAQPAPKSERRCHNRIFLKYLFQLKGLEPSFGFEQVKHAVPIERSTESGIDRCFFIRCTFFFTLH